MPSRVPAASMSAASRSATAARRWVGHQVEGQGADVVGLGVGGESAVGVPGIRPGQAARTRPARSAIAGGLGVPARAGRRSGSSSRVALRVVGGRHIPLVGGGEGVVIGQVGARFEPFTPVEPAVPQVLFVRRRVGTASDTSGMPLFPGNPLGRGRANGPSSATAPPGSAGPRRPGTAPTARRGSEDVIRVTGGAPGVDLAGRQRVRQERQVRTQVIGGDVAVRTQPLGVGQGDHGARRAQVGQPDPAVDVLAKIDDLPARSRARSTATGDDLLHPAHRRRGRVDQAAGPGPRAPGRTRCPAGRVVAGPVPAAGQPAEVDVLAGDQVGRR